MSEIKIVELAGRKVVKVGEGYEALSLFHAAGYKNVSSLVSHYRGGHSPFVGVPHRHAALDVAACPELTAAWRAIGIPPRTGRAGWTHTTAVLAQAQTQTVTRVDVLEDRANRHEATLLRRSLIDLGRARFPHNSTAVAIAIHAYSSTGNPHNGFVVALARHLGIVASSPEQPGHAWLMPAAVEVGNAEGWRHVEVMLFDDAGLEIVGSTVNDMFDGRGVKGLRVEPEGEGLRVAFPDHIRRNDCRVLRSPPRGSTFH